MKKYALSGLSEKFIKYSLTAILAFSVLVYIYISTLGEFELAVLQRIVYAFIEHSIASVALCIGGGLLIDITVKKL